MSTIATLHAVRTIETCLSIRNNSPRISSVVSIADTRCGIIQLTQISRLEIDSNIFFRIFRGRSHAIRRTFRDILDLYIGTAIYANLVVGGTTVSTKTVVGNGSEGGRSRVGVGASHTMETIDLGRRHVDYHCGTVGKIHVLVDLVKGILFGGVERIDSALSEEAQLGIVENDIVESLDRVHLTRSVGVGVHVFVRAVVGHVSAIVAEVENALAFTCVARSATTEDGAVDVHVVVGRLVVVFGMVTFTINIYIGVARNGRSTEGTREYAPVTTSPYGAADEDRTLVVGELIRG